ncbi:hypothetical protein HYW21_07710, partial [Candidatus Woesearchaeota archaeon]|nr:hypothetical protein [Candidatus Woesearchaeota archaeon]
VAPGELALFSVGVMNVLSSMDMFELNLEFKEAYTENRTPITIAPEQAMSWISSVELNQDVKIKQIEKHVFLIGVQPPVTAQKGSYVYNVEIWYDKTMDGVVTDPDLEVGFHKDDHYPRSPKKITVEVK